MSKILVGNTDKKGPPLSVDAKEVINPANCSMWMNFVREDVVAETQSYLLVKTKDGYLEKSTNTSTME
jgi:hypothetical protein